VSNVGDLQNSTNRPIMGVDKVYSLWLIRVQVNRTCRGCVYYHFQRSHLDSGAVWINHEIRINYEPPLWSRCVPCSRLPTITLACWRLVRTIIQLRRVHIFSRHKQPT